MYRGAHDVEGNNTEARTLKQSNIGVWKVPKLVETTELTSCYFSNFVLWCQYLFMILCIMQKTSIQSISGSDTSLSIQFRQVDPPAKQLYLKGDANLLKEGRRLAIVGSRRPTSYGREVTITLARAAAQAGITIVSGLALGIDSTAHQAALDAGGRTIAVLPSSLTKIYPASHTRLANTIVESGGLLVTEYGHDMSPMKHVFLARNRLIAAASDILLVTEGAVDSGSRHTVKAAMNLGMTLAAVPGNITSPLSSLPNEMFRDGATPIFQTADLLMLFGINESQALSQYRPQNEREAVILQQLKTFSQSTQQLLETTSLSIQDLNLHVTMLEIKGVIRQIQRKWHIT
jgi:DNA processing protein